MMNSDYTLNELRVVAAEMLAYAVGQLFPNVLFVGGGALSHGFYYDFIFEQPLYSEMLNLIDVQLRSSAKEGLEIKPLSMMRENAVALLEHHEQPYLAEKASQMPFNIISLLQINQKHFGIASIQSITASTAVIAKLLEMKERVIPTDRGELMVTRLTGTAFSNPVDLKKFVKVYGAYLKKSDHRHLGEKLGLFVWTEGVVAKQPLWLPKGAELKRILRDWLRERDFKHHSFAQVESASLAPSSLFKYCPTKMELQSGAEAFSLSPSCIPYHIRMLKQAPCSVKPVRYFEYERLFQHVDEAQAWGLLWGESYESDLLTVRCSKEQVLEEVISSLQFIEQNIRIFGFKAQWYLVAAKQRTPKAKNEKSLLEYLKGAAKQYVFNYPLAAEMQEVESSWGPRLELRLVDTIGREWSGATVTLVPQNEVEDLILARSVWGSLDRFIALLIEREEGILPLWLAPEQVRIVAHGQASCYAASVMEICQQQGLRITLDQRDERLAFKVQVADKEKIPYMLIIGEQEAKKQEVTVRSLKQPNKSVTLKLDKFLDQIQTGVSESRMLAFSDVP